MSGSTTLLSSGTTVLSPNLQAIRLTDPAVLLVPTTTSVDTVIAGETWTITAPNDIKVTTPENNGGTLKFDIQYTDDSLLHGQYHGIDTVTIKPAVDAVNNLSGFKAPVEFDVANKMSVPIGGFDIMTFNETPVGTPDATNPSGHPSNYAHFHGLSPNAFIPEIVTQYLPNNSGAGVSPSSELRANGTMQPGDTVKANVATFHSAEIGGAKNGFGFNFFPTDNVNPTTSPVIAGLPSSETTDGVPPFLPFANVTVTDTNVLPIERATLTVKDSNGNLTDADPLTGGGLTHDSVGTYSIVSLPKEVTERLHTVQFKDNSPQPNTLTLKVDNSGNNSFPVPAVASTTVILTPSTVSNFTTADQTTGQQTVENGVPYVGPVTGIEWELAKVTPDNLNITANVPNVFIHSGSGTDAIDVSKANGNNILDGSTGSNFLTGGTGHDTFFLDNRNPLADVFSTIVNFHSGDNASVFGVNATDFTLTTLDNQGAVGAKGLDFAFAAPGHANANVVLAGFSKADLGNGRLTVTYGTTPDTPGLPGSQYMNVHAN